MIYPIQWSISGKTFTYTNIANVAKTLANNFTQMHNKFAGMETNFSNDIIWRKKIIVFS